jgi:type IV pilus assembly protein PilM
LSKTLLDSVSQLFRPQVPLWACEFTSRHCIVAGLKSGRKGIAGKQTFDLSPGMVSGSPLETNIPNPDALVESVRSALSQAGFRGSEIGVVIPDDSARITFLIAENIPHGREERDTFVRWKLKKNMPFDVDSAQLAFRVLGPHEGNEGVGLDVLVALSPRSVVEEYVSLMEKLDLHAGFVIPSTMATLNLLDRVEGDTLFVKTAQGSITTSVFRNQRLQFYRRVAEVPIYDAVYPTILYYQDKLAGRGIDRVLVCAEDGDGRAVMDELQAKLGIPADPLEPRNVEDIFKPALGAVGFLWANSI